MYNAYPQIMPSCVWYYRLLPGDSGSIMYAIDKDDKQLYALGMLIGELKLDLTSKSGAIYQAIALWPALKEIEEEFGHRIANIQTVGFDHGLGNRDPKVVVPHMARMDSGIFDTEYFYT